MNFPLSTSVSKLLLFYRKQLTVVDGNDGEAVRSTQNGETAHKESLSKLII